MGMKPRIRVCKICGESGDFNFCDGTGTLTGSSLLKALTACDMDPDSIGTDDPLAVSIPCPLVDVRAT